MSLTNYSCINDSYIHHVVSSVVFLYLHSLGLAGLIVDTYCMQYPQTIPFLNFWNSKSYKLAWCLTEEGFHFWIALNLLKYVLFIMPCLSRILILCLVMFKVLFTFINKVVVNFVNVFIIAIFQNTYNTCKLLLLNISSLFNHLFHLVRSVE